MTRAEAIANWQAKFHPDVLDWLEKGAKASRHYYERDGHTLGRVEAQEALVELARACAATEDET